MRRQTKNNTTIYLERILEKMPSAPDVEEVVLQMASKGIAPEEIFGKLDEGCFYTPGNKDAFLAAKKRYGRPGDAGVGEAGPFTHIGTDMSSAVNLEYYIKILIAYKIRRSVILECACLINKAYIDHTGVDEFVSGCKSHADRVQEMTKWLND